MSGGAGGANPPSWTRRDADYEGEVTSAIAKPS
jgi:hypothetical protein